MSSDAEEIQIPVSWGHISGKWWGPQDRQPILAIHGWQDNAGSFDKLAPMLLPDFSILCIDLPGHGFSSSYPKGKVLCIHWDGLIIARQIVKHFEWKKVTIMGHSLGASIGFLYAATFPDEIDKLICLDAASPAVFTNAEIVELTTRNVEKFLRYEESTKEDMPCYPYADMRDIMMHGHRGSLTPESCKIMLKRGIHRDPESNNYLFARDVRLLSPLGFISLDMALEYASRITCKVLNIKATGTLRHHSYYSRILNKIKETASTLQVHEVKGTHHVHLNNPQDIVSFVINFLKS
ncbi:probable serine hydrolase isoform X2 [Periplaneta americana]